MIDSLFHDFFYTKAIFTINRGRIKKNTTPSLSTHTQALLETSCTDAA